MTEEERKTMIRIATEVDGLHRRVRGLAEKAAYNHPRQFRRPLILSSHAARYISPPQSAHQSRKAIKMEFEGAHCGSSVTE